MSSVFDDQSMKSIPDISRQLVSFSDNGELKQTDAAAVSQQISIQKDSRPNEFTRPLTSFTL